MAISPKPADDRVTITSAAGLSVAFAASASLRERKKRETRERIARVALELFDRQGFAATTIPQIAEAAEVSPRTVSTYFPAKEDLAFPYSEEIYDRLAERLRRRPDGETAAEAMRAWIVGELPAWEDRDDELRTRRRLIDETPALQAASRSYQARGERLLAAAFARDLDASPDDVEPRMAAAAAVAIFDVLGEHADAEGSAPGHRSGAGGHALTDEALVQLDRALAFIDGGIRALGGG